MTLRATAVGVLRAATGLVPDDVLVRMLPPSLRWDSSALAVSTPPRGDVRLFIAPANSAGQGYRWSRAASMHLAGVGGANMMTTNPRMSRLGFPADLTIPETGYLFAGGWQSRQRAAITTGFTHVLIESGRYLFGPAPWKSPLDVARQLERAGVAVGLLWHGSDIRVPSAHAAWETDSPFGARGAYPAESTAILETNAQRHRRMILESDLPVFVSTPGLLDVPRARWLPVVVDVERWRSDRPPMKDPAPTVVYVPTNPSMKGGSTVDRALEALEREGIIRYRRLEGVPAAEMPEIYQSADIVVDQFRLGDYGVAACEAMAAGRVVVGHVHDDVRDRVREVTGRELPIVESRFEDIAATVRLIVEGDRDRWRARAAEGRSFVNALHDGRASARSLAGFLGADDGASQEGHDV